MQFVGICNRKLRFKSRSFTSSNRCPSKAKWTDIFCMPSSLFAAADHDCFGSWLRENSEIEFANGSFVSTSIDLKNKNAGDGYRDKTIEKTILRAFRARTFSRSQGQKRKWRRFQVMSALPHKADIDARDCDVRFVPKIGIGGSLAAPPLPHHRTYGSVYGGSRSYANALRSNDSTRVGWAVRG